MKHDIQISKLPLNKLGHFKGGVLLCPWWCDSSYMCFTLFLWRINALRYAKIQRMGWALKSTAKIFVRLNKAVLFEVREVLTVPLWKCGAEKPHSPSCSSYLCRDSSPMQLSSILEFLEEQGKPLAPVCSLIHGDTAVSLCQRTKPKAMPCTYCRDWCGPPAAVGFQSGPLAVESC